MSYLSDFEKPFRSGAVASRMTLAKKYYKNRNYLGAFLIQLGLIESIMRFVVAINLGEKN